MPILDELPVLAKGTIETIIVDMADKLENVNDLSTTNPRVTVKRKDGFTLMSDVSTTAIEMRVEVLLDTTGVNWIATDYFMWLRFTIGPETPYVKAGKFRVE